MNDDKFELIFRRHRRASIIYPNTIMSVKKYQSVKTAKLKFENKEYLEALTLSWVMFRTNYNFTTAPYIIAHCYENGIKLQKNLQLAIQFYLLSAHYGLYMSNLRLAQIYNLQAFEYPQNKSFYFNMAYLFYITSYKHKDATLYDKLIIAYVLAKIRIFAYIIRIPINEKEVILLNVDDQKHIIRNQCSDLDTLVDNYIKK